MSANFNTSTQLWIDLRKSELRKPTGDRKSIKVIDGHAFLGQDVIARFYNGIHAEQVMAEAGWQRDHSSAFCLFRP